MATYALGLVIIVANCIWCHFDKMENNQGVYGFAVALGIGGSLSLVTCLAMLSQLIGENIETGAFVYGAMSFLDKIANGVVVQVIQIFHPKSDCSKCRQFYRSIMTYVPGVSAVLALLVTATLLDFGSSKDKESLIPQNASIQHKPLYGACQTRKDLDNHKQL